MKKMGMILLAGIAASVMLWNGAALGQGPAGKCPATPETLQGQVVKIDMDQGKVTVRGTDGTTHEFQAAKETLQEYKVGDRIAAKLREAPACK